MRDFKILYINSHHFDYVQDTVYSGLCKVVGHSNIKISPFNRSYCFDMKEYPKNMGYSKGSFYPYLKSRMGFDFNLVIVGSTKVDTFETYKRILPRIPSDVPIVYLDGGDSDIFGGEIIKKGRENLFNEVIAIRPFDLVFKREMTLESTYPENFFPLPICVNLDRVDHIDKKEKKYDVSFWAVESDPIRTKVLDLIKDKWDCEANGTTLNQTFKRYARKGDFYLEELQRCKVVLNFRGGGWDTLRYWEVPALGTFMISGKPGFEIPNNFIDGESIVYCQDDLSDLVEKIDYYLNHESEREEIAKKSREHLLKYHTDKARAEYILERVRSL